MTAHTSHSFDDQAVISLQFNQDYSSLMLGTHCGYSLINTLDESFPEEFQAEGQKMVIIERLFTSSLLTMVPLEETKKLHIYHFKKRMLICHYRYSTSILAVKMNRQRLIVCVEDGIYIHNVRTMEMQHKVEETPPNRRGIVALSSNEENCFFAYPGSPREGSVIIFDAMNFQNVTSIVAHNGLLAAMAFNQSGTELATASEKGTVIRVFAIPSGNRLVEFRRGLARFATISSLTFSLDDTFLVACSNTETVHIFRLETKREGEAGQGGGEGYHPGGSTVNITSRKRSGSDAFSSGSPPDMPVGGLLPASGEHAVANPASGGGWLDWIGGTIKQTASFLPTQFSEMITQDRAFAFARLSPGSADVPKIAAIVQHNRLPRLIVASLDGYLNLFAIDPINGGEALLVKTVNLLAPREGTDTSAPSVGAHRPLQSHQRRHRGESNSSVDSNIPPLGISPSAGGGFQTMTDDNGTYQQSTFPEGDSHLFPYGTDNHSCSFINEGIDNLRLQDQSEFPALPKKSH